MTITVPSNKEPRALVTGSWMSDHELCIVSDVVDTLYGTLYIRLRFDGKKVHLSTSKYGEAIFADYLGEADGVIEK